MTKIQYIAKSKNKIKIMLEYQDLPFKDDPYNEFGNRFWVE